MKKLLAILVLGLLWCNVGFADILLKNCRTLIPAGTKSFLDDSKFSEKEEIRELEDGKKSEYFISFKESVIYYTSVRSSEDISFLEDVAEKGIPTPSPSKTWSKKYIITYVDEKIITATTIIGDDPSYSFIEDITVDLNTNEVERRIYGETQGGKKVVKLYKGSFRYYPYFKRCDQETQSDSSGSSGTAFFINKKGYLLTNNHVVKGCKVSKINYFNKKYDTKLISTDKVLDLALLKANVSPKAYISFSKDEPKKRQQITIAGYPLGEGLSDDLKINDGRISALKGFENNSNEITVDIAINPGNSGGPIVNEKGQLVAIAVAGMSKDVTEGINFGIKASAAANFLKSNKISPSTGYMSFSTSGDKLVKLLEESTVYTFCE